VTKEAKVEIRQLSEFVPDPKNHNTGTQRGLTMLDESISEDGAGRSLLATGDGVLIAGNKTQAALMERGIEEVIVVHTDGTRAVIVQRDDVQAGTDRARLMAYRDNRVGQVDLEFSAEQIAADLADGLDLTGLFFDNEIAEVLGQVADDILDGAAVDIPEQWMIIVECKNEQEQIKLLGQFEKDGLDCRAHIS